MKSSDLQKWQIDKIMEAVRPTMVYLQKLQNRMNVTGFRPDDRLYLSADKAYKALHSMFIDLHYMKMPNQTYQKRERE